VVSPQQYDVVIVGTGFASSFFLLRYLEKARPRARVLILERGQHDTHAWQIQQRRNSSTLAEETFVNAHPSKRWWYTPSLGGGSNCWWGVTPRMMPNDFKLKSVYGVGLDWPVRYDALEEYYQQVEEIMAVSGPDDGSPYPRSKPYPQPPHRFNDPDKLLKAAYPDQFFHLPTARARVPTAKRPSCCASGVCDLCPIDAKFTILNEMFHLFQDPRVTLILGATVQTVDTAGNQAVGVTFSKNGAVETVRGDLIVLGANALFNPHILLRSNIHHPLLGKRLHEQVSIQVTVDLDGVDNFQGSTSMTGLGYMLYDGPHRSQYAAGLLETYNIPYLRMERGKWRRWMIFKIVFEDLPSNENYVKLHEADPALPETVYTGYSEYTQRAIDHLPEALNTLLKPLPVERIRISDKVESTVYHIQGTTIMGDDPDHSVVDRHLIHHQIRNLVVLGSSVFPTGAPANPTLTLSALSLWAANYVLA
jgi:choline dehydrogenase-like flavoprotein